MEGYSLEVTDNDGHRYIIPYEKLRDWNMFLVSDEYEDGIEPEYAERIDGQTVLFKEWVLD